MMEIPENLTGRFAFSRAGHDRGKMYVIIGVEAGKIRLADGAGKTIASPKLKNRRHLQLTNASLSPELMRRLGEGRLRDEELNRELRLYDKESK